MGSFQRELGSEQETIPTKMSQEDERQLFNSSYMECKLKDYHLDEDRPCSRNLIKDGPGSNPRHLSLQEKSSTGKDTPNTRDLFRQNSGIRRQKRQQLRDQLDSTNYKDSAENSSEVIPSNYASQGNQRRSNPGLLAAPYDNN